MVPYPNRVIRWWELYMGPWYIKTHVVIILYIGDVGIFGIQLCEMN